MSALNRLSRSWRGEVKEDSRRWPVWSRGEVDVNKWLTDDRNLSYTEAAKRYTNHDLVYMCAKKLADFSADARLLLFPTGVDRDPTTGLPKMEDALKPEQHPFYVLWQNPNLYDSKAEMIEAITITLQLSPKGVFLHLDDGQRPPSYNNVRRIGLNGEPVALWWLSPEFMSVTKDADTFIKAYIHEAGGQKTEFEPNAIIRIMEFNPTDRYNSLSRVQPGWLPSLSDEAAQRGEWALFKNGYRFDGVITSDKDNVDLNELKLLEKLWKERYQGPDKWGGFFPLWAGFKYQQIAINPADAQSAETAQRNRMRIFGIFGVHPGVILSEDVNLANAKVAEHVTRAFTLRPMLRRIADEITNVLGVWEGAPPAEAHFVNVVPQDTEAETAIDKMRAESASTKAQAVATLVQTFGPETGVNIAKEWQIIPDSVSADEIIQRETEKQERDEARRQENLERLQMIQQQGQQQGGQGQQPSQGDKKATGTIVPVMPPIPDIDEMDDRPGDDEIERMLAKFYSVFPDLAGVLESGSNGKA